MVHALRPRQLFASTLRVFILLAAVRFALPVLAPDAETRMTVLKDDWSSGTAGTRVLAMRSLNPEYDFMSRTFLVMALADEALADPHTKVENLALMDTIIARTLEMEDRQGQSHWLLSYWRPEGTVGTGRSLFVDGEILVMVTARRLVADDRPELRAETTRRSEQVRANLGSGGLPGLAESYANEGWLFCHAMALLGLRAEEVLDGVNNQDLFATFARTARDRLTDPRGSGMLVSSFTMDGSPDDGAEGSSIWFVASALHVVLPDLAREQYRHARHELGRSVLGLGYSREWPAHQSYVQDVDSGPLIPILEASTSASGFALAAARVHGDTRWTRQLDDALGAAEALLRVSPALTEWAGNPVADAVIVWGQGVGPMFRVLEQPTAMASGS